jgi:alpha-aminoadipate/glutamate carrier protein LysW
LFTDDDEVNQRSQKMSNIPSTVECLECAADVPLPQDAMQNEIISCPDCGRELEIMSLNPLVVDYAPEVEEDWGE